MIDLTNYGYHMLSSLFPTSTSKSTAAYHGIITTAPLGSKKGLRSLQVPQAQKMAEGYSSPWSVMEIRKGPNSSAETEKKMVWGVP